MAQGSSIRPREGLAPDRFKSRNDQAPANNGEPFVRPKILRSDNLTASRSQNRSPLLRTSPQTRAEFAPRPKLAADRAGGAAAALSGRAAISRRTPGLDPDGLALADRGAGQSPMGRIQRDLAVPAAFGGRGRGCQILQPSRHRLGRAARRDG